VTTDRFASTAADALLGCDQATGRKLMRTAMRLLAHGRPVTLADLAAAAGVEVDDLRNAPAGQDI
jgi:alkylmercury lyase